MRKAFTMVEIIFVIVIIGVLAAVAVPMMNTNRDDSTSSVCALEVGILLNEIGTTYTRRGYKDFIAMNIDDMTDINKNVDSSHNGILEDDLTKVHNVGVTYACEGEAVLKIVTSNSGENYILTIEDESPTGPAALKAAIKLRKAHRLSEGSSRVFIL